MELPSTENINDNRVAKFKQRISDTLATEEFGFYFQMLEQYQHEQNVPALEIAAALAQLLQGDTPFLLSNKPARRDSKSWDKEDGGRKPRRERDRDRSSRDNKDRSPRKSRDSDRDTAPAKGMQSYRIDVGHDHGVKPGNIVGAIANEADIDSQYIGRIQINDDHSTIDLPEGMPTEVMKDLKKIWVSGQQLNIVAITKKIKLLLVKFGCV